MKLKKFLKIGLFPVFILFMSIIYPTWYAVFPIYLTTEHFFGGKLFGMLWGTVGVVGRSLIWNLEDHILRFWFATGLWTPYKSFVSQPQFPEWWLRSLSALILCSLILLCWLWKLTLPNSLCLLKHHHHLNLLLFFFFLFLRGGDYNSFSKSSEEEIL